MASIHRVTSSELYKRTRNWENTQIGVFPSAGGRYDIPKMQPVYEVPDLDWIGFNYARSCDTDERAQHGVHFWLDDYQFSRLWSDPARYLSMLKQFGAVMSPDFSVYNDFPRALKVWNVYRNAWLACYWQSNGILVIPTIMWGSPDTLDYCFDGYPEAGIVAISTEGNLMSEANKQSFLVGYEAMLDRLHPCGVIVHGKILDGMGKEVISQVPTFTSRMKKRTANKPLDAVAGR